MAPKIGPYQKSLSGSTGCELPKSCGRGVGSSKTCIQEKHTEKRFNQEAAAHQADQVIINMMKVQKKAETENLTENGNKTWACAKSNQKKKKKKKKKKEKKKAKKQIAQILPLWETSR